MSTMNRANAEDSVTAFAEHIGHPLMDWQRGFAAGLLKGYADLLAAPVRWPRRTEQSRRIARAFGLTLLDLDPGLARDVRRAHVEYDRRRRARRRRNRA